jgi:sugar-specific transcriptional regulator TrmB
MNRSDIYNLLELIGLRTDEAKIWLDLLGRPKTHLEIAQATGIGRTTVYRLVDSLNAKSLSHELLTERGRFIEAATPEALELMVQQEEVEIVRKRAALNRLTHELHGHEIQDATGFYVKTYYGVTGLKQMLWNELSMSSESVQFTKASLNDLAGPIFADKFRAEIIRRNISQRALENVRGVTQSATKLDDYIQHYSVRVVDPTLLDIGQELTVHDDIVSIYNWENDMHVGTETKNMQYASFMRQIFESFWCLAEE